MIIIKKIIDIIFSIVRVIFVDVIDVLNNTVVAMSTARMRSAGIAVINANINNFL